MKSCNLRRKLEREAQRWVNQKVLVRGGGQRTRGVVKSAQVSRGRIFLKVSIHLGEFTFPAEALELL